MCVVCGSNDRTLSPAASSRVRRARPRGTTLGHTHSNTMWATTMTSMQIRAGFNIIQLLFFQLFSPQLRFCILSSSLLVFRSMSPPTIRPFVLHCFLVGRRREEAFPVFVRCRGREAFPEQRPSGRVGGRINHHPGKMAPDPSPQEL